MVYAAVTLKSYAMWQKGNVFKKHDIVSNRRKKMQLERLPGDKMAQQHRLKDTKQTMKRYVGILYLTALCYEPFPLFCLPSYKSKRMARIWTLLWNICYARSTAECTEWMLVSFHEALIGYLFLTRRWDTVSLLRNILNIKRASGWGLVSSCHPTP